MEYYTTTSVARQLSVSPNSIRNWCIEYGEFLSDTARRKSRRQLNEDDVLVLATVENMRQAGMPHSGIKLELRNGVRVESVPPAPTREADTARNQIQLVAKNDLDHALERESALMKQLDTALSERDAYQVSSEQANTRILELERDLGELRGEIKVLRETYRPVGWWLRVVSVVAVAIVALVLLLQILNTTP